MASSGSGGWIIQFIGGGLVFGKDGWRLGCCSFPHQPLLKRQYSVVFVEIPVIQGGAANGT